MVQCGMGSSLTGNRINHTVKSKEILSGAISCSPNTFILVSTSIHETVIIASKISIPWQKTLHFLFLHKMVFS